MSEVPNSMNQIENLPEQESFIEKDKQVYWDDEKDLFYWIEWIETGNNDIPVKHYIKEI